MEDMDGYTGGCVGVMGKAMTEMVIVFFVCVCKNALSYMTGHLLKYQRK
jgi:hypothetical protein